MSGFVVQANFPSVSMLCAHPEYQRLIYPSLLGIKGEITRTFKQITPFDLRVDLSEVAGQR